MTWACRVIAALLALVRVSCALNSLVHLNYTSFQGTSLPNGVTQWLGMRYAAAPLGDLRFAAPQPPPSNNTVQIADQHGPLCLKTAAPADDPATSEDCLFMDIYAPTNATQGSLGVYFFIQGGGFNENSNANNNGSGLIQASNIGIVVVTFNYRVGPYGFLASQEVQEGASLNNGLKDQRLALQWVQQNIAQFGGDPTRVTMAGDSAGAASVNLQTTAFGGRDDGLWAYTAAESQSFATIYTVNQSQYQYDQLVIRTECVNANDTLACLRSLNSTFLQQHNINTPFPMAAAAPLYQYSPTLDYDFVTDYTYNAYDSGKFVRVPAIAGDDTNEGTIFVPNTTANLSTADIFLRNQFPYLTLAQLRTINGMYPITAGPTYIGYNNTTTGAYWESTADAYAEIRYVCPGVFISEVYQRYNVQGNWNYHWDVHDPTQDSLGYGVTHTVEVNAIWGPQYVNATPPASYFTTNANIVPVIQKYWTSFVSTGNPNTYRLPGSPTWNQWSANGSYSRIHFVTNATAMEQVPSAQQSRCAYLNSIGLALHQ